MRPLSRYPVSWKYPVRRRRALRRLASCAPKGRDCTCSSVCGCADATQDANYHSRITACSVRFAFHRLTRFNHYIGESTMLTKTVLGLFTAVAAAVGAVSLSPSPGVVDCCKAQSACCDATRACCSAESLPACCAEGMKCCEENLACCDAAPECCVEGRACCQEGKACCDVASAASAGPACCKDKAAAVSTDEQE